MPLPVAARLIDFGQVRNDGPGSGSRLRETSRLDAAGAEEERIEAAFARGRSEGFEAGQAELDAKLKEAEAAAGTQLVEARAMWAAEQGAAIADQMTTALGVLTTDVQNAVAAILTPFVETALRQTMVEELARTLETLLAGGEGTTLAVSGPADLLDRLRAKLGAQATAIEFAVADTVDVRAVAGQTVIESQLEAWLQRISGRGG